VADLSKLLRSGGHRAFESTLARLVKSGLLERPIRGVYVYALSSSKGVDTLEHIARVMRRGEYNYISLESALSEYGVISQIPIDRLTVMTTGRKGEYKTPYGVIEFTHTERSLPGVLDSMLNRDRPLKIATLCAALRDLKRVGRNMHLVQESDVYDEEE
jgi:predicted transcriptional regulator of viral defense system